MDTLSKMIEKIFQNPSKVQRHLHAPMFRERDDFICKMHQKGFCLRYLQITADYLFFAVNNLNIGPNEVVSLERIVQSTSRWYTSKKGDYQVTVLKWLDSLNMLDARYNDVTNLLVSFSSVSHYRVRYLTYPLYQERLSYLLQCVSIGMARSTVREQAEMQLHIIDVLKLHSPRIVCVKELQEASSSFSSLKSRNMFMTTAQRWLSFIGILDGGSEPTHINGYNYVVDYINWARESKGLSATTLNGRERELKTLLSFMEQKSLHLSYINLNHIDEYIMFRQNSGCNRKTIATIVTTIRDFIRYLRVNNLCELIPDQIKHPKSYDLDTLPNCPSWGQTQEIISYYDGKNDALSLRNKAIMYLIATYGLRSSEVVNLKTKDIDWKNNHILLRRAKRGGLQRLPLVPIVGNAIAEYIKSGRNNDIGSEYIFLRSLAPITQLSRTAIYVIVSEAYSNTDINIKHKGGHSLRHACATHLINSGRSLKEISDLLGHRLLDTTRVYAKVDMSTLSQVAKMDWEGVIC